MNSNDKADILTNEINVIYYLQKREVKPGPNPPNLSLKKMISFLTPVLFDTAKWRQHFGDCVEQPESIVYPGDIVTVSFVSIAL